MSRLQFNGCRTNIVPKALSADLNHELNMNRINLYTMAIAAGTLILIGAGCGQGQIAIPADRMNSESALSYQLGNPADASQQAARTQAPPASSEASAAGREAASGSVPPTTPAAENWPRPTAFPGILRDQDLRGKQARIMTAKGEIVFELLDREGPKAASNFIALARSGYYDGVLFHRVEPGFVVQGGDPLTRDPGQRDRWGTGGPGYEFGDDPVTLDYKAGIVAMANPGRPDANGSQFFIVLEDQPTLPKNYSIFGRVISGMDAVRRIAVGDVITSVVIEDKQ